MSGRGIARPTDLAGPVLALDLGGTQIRAAVVVDGGIVVATHRAPTPIDAGGAAIVAACVDALAAVRREDAATSGPRHFTGVGISAPGPVDPGAGMILDPPNLGPTFREIPLASRIEDALGLPTFLDRDTQVAALAEGRFGAAAGCADFVYVTISTGIGGAVVSDGRLLRGPDGTAGELGHLMVDRGGAVCGCGMRGHLEGIASGSGMARSARAAVERGESIPLAELILRRGPAFGGRDVAAAAEAGDPVAAGILAGARDAFAVSCVTLVDVFNPSLIVVGGGVAVGQGERILAPARAAVAAGAFGRPGARVRIVPAALGDDVGLVGGLVLVAERQGATGGREAQGG
ncbi:MAG: ROK family protein [Chloroflexota bacterium]